jgi:hypothetical protein
MATTVGCLDTIGAGGTNGLDHAGDSGFVLDEAGHDGARPNLPPGDLRCIVALDGVAAYYIIALH